MSAFANILPGETPVTGFEYRGGVGARTHWAVTRTDSGRIVASGSGLIEFAGGGWRQLSPEGNLNWQALSSAADGRIWASAENEIGVYEPDLDGALHYRSLTPLLHESDRDLGDVWNVFPRESGTVFVAREQVVWTDGAHARTWRLPVERRLFSWMDRGEVWIGGTKGRIFRMTRDGPVPVATTGVSSESTLYWGEGVGSENWIAMTQSGLVSSEDGSTERFAVVNRLLGTSAPVSTLRLENGRLAVATFLRGLFLIDTASGGFEQIEEGSGLPSKSVVGLMAGGDDWLWAVTTRGLARIAVSPAVSIVKDRVGLDASSMKFAEAVDGSVIIGSDSGRFVLSIDGSEHPLKKSSGQWYSVSTRFNDMLLCGSMTGISRVTAEKGEWLIPESRNVAAIVADVRDTSRIFYATGSVVRAARWENGGFKIESSTDMGLEVLSMVESADGSLWVASGRKVARMTYDEDREIFVVRAEVPLVSDSAAPDGQVKMHMIGDMVVAVVSGKLFARAGDSGAFEPLQTFANVEFVAFAAGPDGDAWALARPVRFKEESARLLRLRAEAGSLSTEVMEVPGVLALGALGTLHFVDLPGGARELWIGAKDGIVRVNPAFVQAAGALPRLAVEVTRRAEGVETGVPGFLAEFPFNPGALTFRWSAPDLVRGDLLVETRIAGAGEDWSPASGRDVREFAGLGDGSYAFEARAVDALGRAGPVVSRAFTVLPPWYRTTGAITGFIATALLAGGISWQLRLRVARRRAEELEGLVEERTRELERVNAEKTRFIARMNHEIRNPLNGLLGAVGVLEQFSHKGKEGRVVQILRACADHLGAVVEDVLDFSNIEGGRIVVQDRAVSIAAMLEAVPRMLNAESERTGTEVVTTIAPDVPSVVIADPDRIRQILINFLGNALKYAPGEPVHIDVNSISVDGSPWLRFAVRDHGPGIAESDKQMLFSMFERGRGAPARNARGMGIGLATCRLLARRMGGEVGVISGLGEGSEFYLRLPLKVEAGAVPLPEATPLDEHHKLACLLIEDQEFNRVILKDMLTRFGCTVDEAPNAEMALGLAAMNRYDVVFTDLELPDAAPGEILGMLRNRETPADTTAAALVVTTAYATENVRQTCLDAGATAFLAKPISASKVLSVLREIDAARRPSSAVETPASQAAPQAANVFVSHLARLRGCSIESAAADVSRELEDEVRKLRAGVGSEDLRLVAHQAHRLLSLAALADTPELAGVATGIQNDGRAGRMPATDRLEALDHAVETAKARLGAITSVGAADGQNRGPGRIEPTASSHSD